MDKSSAKTGQQNAFGIWSRVSNRWLNIKEKFLGLILSTLLINILGLTLPLFIYQVYDRVLPNAATETLTVLALVVASLIVCESFLKLMRQYVLLWGETKAQHGLSSSAFEKIIQAHPAALPKTQAEKFLNLLQSSDAHKHAFHYQALIQCVELPFVVIYLALIASISLPLATMLALVQALVICSAFLTLKHQERYIKVHQTCKEQKNSLVNQMIEGIHTLKSLSMEAFYLRKFDQLIDKEIENLHHVDQIHGQKNRLLSLGNQLSVVTVIGVGCYLVMHNQMTLGALTACILLANRSLQPLKNWIEWVQQAQQQKNINNRLQAIYTLPQESKQPLADDIFDASIELLELGSRDPLTGFWLLKDLSLQIQAGQTIALVSENQAAASHLLKIMAGLIPPTQGHVLVSNKDLYGQALYGLRQHITYLSHDGALFTGTILDNITMFRTQTLGVHAKQVAEDLGLAALVEALPMGFQTLVGFGASDHVSRGIKQLIVIARGLIHQPKIILFNQANTALDELADQQLRKYLQQCKGQTTMVLVSHRPSMIEWADETIVIDPMDSPMSEASEVA